MLGIFRGRFEPETVGAGVRLDPRSGAGGCQVDGHHLPTAQLQRVRVVGDVEATRDVLSEQQADLLRAVLELPVRQGAGLEFVDRLDSLIRLAEDAQTQQPHHYDQERRRQEGGQQLGMDPRRHAPDREDEWIVGGAQSPLRGRRRWLVRSLGSEHVVRGSAAGRLPRCS